MLNLDFLDKGLGIVSPADFVYHFSKKNVPRVVFYYLTKFNCQVAFTS